MSVDTDEVVAQDKPKTAPKSWKSHAITWARRVLLVAVVVGAGYYLVTRWDEVWTTLTNVPWYAAVGSLLVLIAGMLANTWSWRTIVDDLGSPIGRVLGSQIFLVSQLGKYVPGAVWAYVLQMELGKKAGLPRARMFVASLVQVGVAVVASLALGVLALPMLMKDSPGAVWLYALLPFGLAVLHPKVMTWAVNLVLKVLRKAPLPHPLHFRTIVSTLLFTTVSYVCFGAHLWLLTLSTGKAGIDVLLLCIGAIAIGLTASLFFFILPSGAGVRDLAVALALGAAVGSDAAVAFAVASRAMFTFADVATAGGAALLAKLTNPTAKAKPAEAAPAPAAD
ncbi:hypothetical protein ALI144C_42235 [Actinosynnema sp. ALI-1.44]|uniref:lysylphosphatidylglycerol synthase domain-containing protein n=1 Tax=Actinosynnema sp. ALI-1.44 TaxID=1933779 RepID=UPI00097BE462|nr:lysylphosphatidylglycerol synthase domain-containing protein [Actinosynnema sp. ALI-1.44]ONI72641.1 hypothetical protein ALI144C_42235 [Actinosynnema sp. ALI-1.44]